MYTVHNYTSHSKLWETIITGLCVHCTPPIVSKLRETILTMHCVHCTPPIVANAVSHLLPVRLPKREINDRQVAIIEKVASLGGLVVVLEGRNQGRRLKRIPQGEFVQSLA